MALLFMVGAVCGSIMAIVGLVTLIIRGGRRTVRLVGDEMRSIIDERLDAIHAELNPNHGTSFRDQVFAEFGQLNDRVDRLDGRVDTIDKRLFRAEMRQ